jgi:hypothetical protein
MARLPFSAERLEGDRINLRDDRLPVRFSHEVREIDECMDDIVYNAIDVIQEEARANELRTFYFNLMSDRNWKNRDFENLIGMIGDMVDIGVSDGRFRGVRDAIIAVTEEVITLHVAFMTDEYPDLMEYVDRGQERDIDRAVRMYEKYVKGVEVYRRNGYRLPSGGRGRDRDDYDDRDRGRGANLGSDRGDRGGRGRSRRDEWDRGAVRGGVHGSPRRTANRENLYGNSDQSDRFDDDAPSNRGNDRRDKRDDRDDRDTSRRNDDRYDDARPVETSERRPSRIQRLPGSDRHSDIDDALARENNEAVQQGSENMNQNNRALRSESKNPILQAFENQDAWVPSEAHPHPFVFNHTQDLFYELDLSNQLVIPRVINKDRIVDYYAHASMAFGPVPKDFSRFEEGGVAKRLEALHTALINPSEKFDVEGKPEETVTYHNRLDLTDSHFLGYSLKEILLRLNYRRFITERKQVNGETFHPIEIAIGRSLLMEPFIVTEEEAGYLEELRQVTSFTKMAEKLRQFSKRVRKELFLQLDEHLTRAVNRMLRQHLSIPALKITSFTSDWLELFAHVTEKFGEAYRDAITIHQERELNKLMNFDHFADQYTEIQMNEKFPGVKTFVAAMPTKIIFLNEVGFNLDIDMVPDVASQLLPEDNPFFHDLAQDLLTKDADAYGRFYIQTSDMRVIEASRSFLNEKAVLLRMIK